MTISFIMPMFDGDAACAEVGGDEWYPEPGDPGSISVQAKKVCAGCEILVECREWALDNAEGYGIWGGLTEKQRRRLTGRRRRRAA